MAKNLFKRIITSFILLTILLIVIFGNEIIFLLSLSTLCILVCFEANSIFGKIINKKKLKTPKKDKNQKEFNGKFLFLNIATFLYVFLIFFNFSNQIYKIEGPIFFLLIISVCFFSDIGGYVIGKSIGGKKLTKISPNKTISGSIGSFIFSLIPIIIPLTVDAFDYQNSIHLSKLIMITLLLSLICQCGDLLISYFKRKANVKDTGSILPGHGGLLDRIDGLIFVVPTAYLIDKTFF